MKRLLLAVFPCLDCKGMDTERKQPACRHELFGETEKDQPLLVEPAGSDLKQVLWG